ncbi:MAG: hypothetical protein DRN04_00820 [Thermoprotei archaeon]|nr:MAG: hypothetical protein DRN04_00820 [Thermoprotei archaeon]
MFPYYWYSRYYYPFPVMPAIPPDPMALLYMWPYLWLWYMSMMYYIELYKITIDMWRKWAESAFKYMSPTTSGTS